MYATCQNRSTYSIGWSALPGIVITYKKYAKRELNQILVIPAQSTMNHSIRGFAVFD